MPADKPRSLGDFADDRARARFDENQAIARDNRTLRATLAERDAELGAIRGQLRLVSLLEARALAPPSWLTPKSSTAGNVGIPTLLLTDLHWDEMVYPEQIGGFNKYNRKIAEQRLRRVIEKSIVVARDYLKGVKYEGFQLSLGGDNFSGIIRDELRETNEATIMESLVAILDPLAAGIALLADEFARVNIAAVVGNHGRNTKKPRAKFRAQDNFDWLLYKVLEARFQGDKRITWNIGEGPDVRYALYRTKYLLTHGDQFHGGSGISGALAPLLLGAHRKTGREVAIGQPYDVMVMGHWHQTIPLLTHGLLVGGSLIGYNEYAYQENLKPEPAQQAFWVTTPEHGPTFFTSIFAQDRKTEGW